MTRWLTGLALLGTLGMALGSWTSLGEARAQSPNDNAVAALVTEVRALRADLAAASQRSLRTQLLLGRLEMQEQRIAYLDRQRADAAAKVMDAAQAVSGMGTRANVDCSASVGNERTDCELRVKEMARQMEVFRAREQQLRAQEAELVSAVQAEQSRWSDVNAQLDSLERTLR